MLYAAKVDLKLKKSKLELIAEEIRAIRDKFWRERPTPDEMERRAKIKTVPLLCVNTRSGDEREANTGSDYCI